MCLIRTLLGGSFYLYFNKIDEIYNHKVKLFLHAEAGIDELFRIDDKESSEENFMIKRSVSRLRELQTLRYFNMPHNKDST